MIFTDRYDAGRQLAEKLVIYQGRDTLVLGLARGGVPVAYEVAKKLHAPLDVLVVRKIGAPFQKELGIGALAPGECYLDSEIVRRLGISPDYIDQTVKEETAEMIRREEHFRDHLPQPQIRNKTIILVDDGLATGVTAKAAILSVKKQKPKELIYASPVCAAESAMELRPLVEEIVCLNAPYDFLSVGYWYRHFEQTSNEEVRELLQRSRGRYEGLHNHP